MVWLFAVVALSVGLPQIVLADDSGGRPELSFGASVSYGYDFNDPIGSNDDQNKLGYSSLEQDESFNIDMVQIGVSGERGSLSYEGKIDFGDLAAQAGDSDDGDVALQTMNIAYDFGGVVATAGRFATPIGYEVLEPWGNAHISRSRGWHAQPINHDGITAGFGLDVVDVLLGVANGFTVADQRIRVNDPDDEKAIILGFGAPIGEAHTANVTGIYSQDDDSIDRWMVNAILSGVLNYGDIEFDYAVEGNWRSDEPDGTSDSDIEFLNIGAYVGTSVGAGSVHLRVDFTDDEGLLTSDLDPSIQDSQVTSVSVTGSYPLGAGVDARVEYRYDTSNEDIFGEDDPGNMSDIDNLIQVQVVWHPDAG
jgi:hypothetical protein